MKYSNYIINGRPVSPEQLGIIALPAAVVGLFVLIGLLPAAVLMDGGRLLRLRYLLRQRELRRINYARGVIRSLEHEETKELISLLIAA